MGDSAATPPAGFISFEVASTHVVCVERLAHAVRTMLSAGSLYDHARTHRDARSLAGRGVAYAVPLPGSTERVVVRHNRHGGLFASLTGDLFRWPSRAPLELATSMRLVHAGIATPAFAAFAVYPAALAFCRADVMTFEVPSSRDLSAAIMNRDVACRAAAWRATAQLIRSLAAAGARHHDLNVKNVLLRDSADGQLDALVLDVDRVTFSSDRAAVLEANLARLLRSARKWQATYGAPITDSELAELAAMARGPGLSSTRS
ncbi:MAG TPA: lipopolysaccharide kinase InaA family protein [Gemmatimonadaceae bacterium]|nr:lipopolysaccharide kinase InaA family protein [Gemmatimonadaceae bacterium]